jgi:hypothetical protein
MSATNCRFGFTQMLGDRSLRSRRDLDRVTSAPVGRLETNMATIRTLAAVCSTVALLVGIASYPARADDDGWRGRGHGREWREHEWREHERAPTVVYESAPPTVVYQQAPPAVVYQPASPPAVVYEQAPPPPVVYETAPAPVVVAPPPPAVVYQSAPVVAPAPTLDIVVPLHFH